MSCRILLVSIVGLGCGVDRFVNGRFCIGESGRGGALTRRWRLDCDGVGVMDGKPIDELESLISERLGGATDCSEPSRLRVLENNDVGDRSRILSSKVLVLGRDIESVRLRDEYPLLPTLCSGRCSREGLFLWPLPGDTGEVVLNDDGSGDVVCGPLDIPMRGGSGVTALTEFPANASL